MSKIRNWLTQIGLVVSTVIITLAGVWLWQNVFNQKPLVIFPKGEQVTVVVDKLVILKEIQSEEKLQTVKQVLQREVEVTLDLGDFSIFGWTLLENKRVQKFAITGYVIAGVDLSKLKPEDINLDEKTGQIRVRLPNPEILDVNILEEQTQVLKDKITLLYNLESLNPDRRKELNEKLFQLVLKESKKALVEAACAEQILSTAGQNAAQATKKLFGVVLQPVIVVETTPATNCTWPS